MNDASHDPVQTLRELCQQVRERAPQPCVSQTPASPARQKAQLIAAEILKQRAQKGKGE